jgi:putative cardiolipin synthase
MHNKSFSVDDQVAIVGGRNVGDEYFDAGTRLSYIDMDVLTVGPVVREVADEFDLYWNSASAYPAGALLGVPPTDSAETLTASFAATRLDPLAGQYLDALRETQVVSELAQGHLSLEWTRARLVYDDPAKVLDEKPREDLLLLARLLGITDPPRTQFDLISPYFVPRSRGGGDLKALAGRGVQVRVLTNSLESTDVSAVHAGYIKYRKDLLRAGVKLYELERQELPQRSAEERKAGVRSATGLHAKTFQIDGKVAFVGSFNFDPRSAYLNTEMGVVIDSAMLAQRITQFFDSRVRSVAYELQLNPKGEIEWTILTAGGPRVYHTEPGTSSSKRAQVRLLSLLPIDGLL